MALHKPPEAIKPVSLLRKVLMTTTRLVVTTINQIAVVPGWALFIVCIQPARFINYKWYLSLEGLLYTHLLELVAYWGWVQGFRR